MQMTAINHLVSTMNNKHKEADSNGKTQYMKVVQAIEQLDLNVKDMSVKSDDFRELTYLLEQILAYPSTKQAQIHRQANRLGTYDLDSNDKYQINSSIESIQIEQQYCNCCGFIVQTQELKLCSDSLKNVSNIGISTYLYFQTILNLIIMMIIAGIIFSIFTLITNIIASQVQNVSSVDFLAISLGSKQNNLNIQSNVTYLLIQSWLGLAMIIIWGICFFLFKFFERKNEVRVEKQTKSAADYSIVIEGMPTNMTLQQVQQQFNRYRTQLKNTPQWIQRPMKIMKYNQGKPFYLQQSQIKDQQFLNLIQQSNNMINLFASWILQRQQSLKFKTSKEQRQKRYKQYAQILTKKIHKYEELHEKIISSFKQKNKQPLTTVFITFESTYICNEILLGNNYDIFSQIRYFITCSKSENHFKIKQQNQQSQQQQQINVFIQKAPQPQDIIWSNLGVSHCNSIKKKFITYFSTFFLLALSFGIVYGLSVLQIQSTSNRYLSILISIVIIFFNFLMRKVLRQVSLYQKDYTITRYQTSLAIKTIAAQLINSILTPLIVNIFIKENNIYTVNGLANDVFIFGILSTIIPLAKIFDFYYLFLRIQAWYYNRPKSKLYLNQNQLNLYYQYAQFEVGFEYIYLINFFLFTCFFISLQPILVIFNIAGYILMHWVQKFSLYQYCKRPVPGTDLLNIVMNQTIYLGALFYSLGNLTWLNLLPDSGPNTSLIPNLIALGFSVLILLLPYKAIFILINNQDIQHQQKYLKNRIYLPSEYDRLNPSTSKQAFKQYMQFLNEQKQQLKNASDQVKNSMAKIFQHQGKQNFHRQNNHHFLLPFHNHNRDDQIIARLFQQRNQSVNPLLIGCQLFNQRNSNNRFKNNHNGFQQQNLMNLFKQPSNSQNQRPQQQNKRNDHDQNNKNKNFTEEGLKQNNQTNMPILPMLNQRLYGQVQPFSWTIEQFTQQQQQQQQHNPYAQHNLYVPQQHNPYAQNNPPQQHNPYAQQPQPNPYAQQQNHNFSPGNLLPGQNFANRK